MSDSVVSEKIIGLINELTVVVAEVKVEGGVSLWDAPKLLTLASHALLVMEDALKNEVSELSALTADELIVLAQELLKAIANLVMTIVK